MNMNKLTQKSQEAFYGAQNIAIKHGHQEVDVEHLALALLSQENGLIPKLITRMGLPAENIINAIEIELRKDLVSRGRPGGRKDIRFLRDSHSSL